MKPEDGLPLPPTEEDIANATILHDEFITTQILITYRYMKSHVHIPMIRKFERFLNFLSRKSSLPADNDTKVFHQRMVQIFEELVFESTLTTPPTSQEFGIIQMFLKQCEFLFD